MIIKKLLTSLLIVLLSVMIGTIAMIGIYQLPTKMMFNNIKKSISLYQAEGLYPNWTGRETSAQLDNFTDAIMLGAVIYPGSSSTIKDAMLNSRYEYKANNPVESLISQINNAKKDRSITHYARYWHGYLVILKPGTMFLDISYVHLLNALLQIIVAACLIMLIADYFGKGYGFSFFLAYLLMNPVSLAMSFQFSTSYYVMSLVSLAFLRKKDYFIEKQKFIYLFLISGILTAFFDLLTYPVTTLGIPLVLLLVALHQSQKLNNYFDAIKTVVLPSIFWGVGYAGMHLGKWLMAWMLTGYNVMSEAFTQLQYRMSYTTMGTEGSDIINPIKAISKNFQVILHEPIFAVLLIVLIASLWKLFKLRKLEKCQNNCVLKFALGLVMLFPFIWYTLLCNHSFVHRWFTYRSLSVFVFAVGSIIATSFLEYQNKDYSE